MGRTGAFSVAARARSFVHAVAGLRQMLRTEHNARVHLVATAGVLAAGAGFGLSGAEWLAVIIAITLVWLAEAINTAIESVCDTVHPGQHPGIGRAKDAAAAGVLCAALGAMAIGLIVFLPYLRQALR